MKERIIKLQYPRKILIIVFLLGTFFFYINKNYISLNSKYYFESLFLGFGRYFLILFSTFRLIITDQLVLTKKSITLNSKLGTITLKSRQILWAESIYHTAPLPNNHKGWRLSKISKPGILSKSIFLDLQTIPMSFSKFKKLIDKYLAPYAKERAKLVMMLKEKR